MPKSWIFRNWQNVWNKEKKFRTFGEKVLKFLLSDIIDIYMVKGNKGKGRKKGIYKKTEAEI